MPQPKQRTYADLHLSSAQRSATSSSSSRPAGTSRPTQDRGVTATEGAAAAACAAGQHHTSGEHTGAQRHPATATPAALAANKASRIPAAPAQQHAAPAHQHAATAAAAAAAAVQSRALSPSAIPHVAPSAPPQPSAATAVGHAGGAVANGSSHGLDAGPPSTQQVERPSSRHARSATLAESSDWSQDSSNSSSCSEGGSPTPESGSSKRGSKVHGSQGPIACQNGSHEHQQQQQQQHQQQHQQQPDAQQMPCAGIDSLQQLHLGDSSLQPLRDPQLQQQQQVGAQQQQEEQRLHSVPQQQPDHQQQDSSADGGPGPPGNAAAAVAGVAVAAAAGDAAAVAAGTGTAAEAAADIAAGSSDAGVNGAAVIDSAVVRARMSADPDYELPQGKLTETQVLLAHGNALRLDRYGFILGESDMAGRTAGAAAAAATKKQRTAAQVRREQRHVAKWRRMLGSSAADFDAYCREKMKKVKRRVRKGVPDEFRGYVWQLLSGGHSLMQSHPGMYARLLSHSPDAIDLEIMRDLNRTFPNHVFFHQRQGPGQQSLFHVLRAYSALDKQVGYVQGMGFVSAILLMYMSEEAAFWTLVALLKGTPQHPPLEGLYQAGMPLLQQCLFQFHELLKQEHPRLGHHLEQEGVVPSMYCTHWFNTLFAYSLPFEHLLRVWDVFLLEGMKVVFRVGVALLASAQDQLCSMPFERLVAALNGRKFPLLNKHPDALMKAALRIPVSKQLEQLRLRFLALQAESRQEAAAASAGGAGSAAAGMAAAGSSAGAAAASGSGGVARSGTSHSSKSSAAHAQQQLIAGLAPVPMGPNS